MTTNEFHLLEEKVKELAKVERILLQILEGNFPPNSEKKQSKEKLRFYYGIYEARRKDLEKSICILQK